MVNVSSSLLHTDNGLELCNQLLLKMLEEFNLRHVRGRARCPWIQWQVESANPAIKWMIGSMLMTTD